MHPIMALIRAASQRHQHGAYPASGGVASYAAPPGPRSGLRAARVIDRQGVPACQLVERRGLHDPVETAKAEYILGQVVALAERAPCLMTGFGANSPIAPLTARCRRVILMPSPDWEGEK